MSERSEVDRRLTQRFGLDSPMFFGQVLIEKKITFPLRDLSYGGFSVHIPSLEVGEESKSLPKTVALEIDLLGAKMSGEATRVFEGKQRHGFSFCHETASMLVFLRRFLEMMRLGSQATLLDKKLVKEQYQGPEWYCFRGEGPVDILMRSSSDISGLEEALITFREKEEYRSVSLRENQVTSNKSIDLSGAATRMAPTPGLDADLARKSVCLLIGILQEKNSAIKTVEALIEKIVGAMGRVLPPSD